MQLNALIEEIKALNVAKINDRINFSDLINPQPT